MTTPEEPTPAGPAPVQVVADVDAPAVAIDGIEERIQEIDDLLNSLAPEPDPQ
ncbi:hypothetical protein ACIPW9_36070 [Streptomyces sp. NPDC090052]|uniref:hypothetical protein n=1 Tax=Streptomyces sp. NPDC090052 TaxID=3365931 RepID=UPI00381F67AD